MNDLLHIRVSKELKKEMEKLISAGLFSTQNELVKEGIREIILKYEKTSKEIIKNK